MTAAAQIKGFLAKYTPEIASQLQAAREHLASHFPQGFELVYDNYNALVFGIASSMRASDVIVSVAGYPKWVTLFFFRGVDLPDPTRILEGSGAQIRSVRLHPPSKLHEPSVQALIAAARASASSALAAAPPLTTVIKSVSAKQRERKPATGAKAASPKARRAGRSGA